MERSEHSLAPQWMKSSGNISQKSNKNGQLASSPYMEMPVNITSKCDHVYTKSSQDHNTYSVRRRSSRSKGSDHSRSYSTSGRSWHDMDWQKDIDILFEKDNPFFRQLNHYSSDNMLASKLERDQLLHSQPMISGRQAETRSDRTTGDFSNPRRNDDKSGGIFTDSIAIMHKSVLEEEFPLLGVEDKRGGSGLGKVLSSGSSTSSHSLPNGTSTVIVNDGLASASHELPVNVGSSSMAVMLKKNTVSSSSSSIAPVTMGLSMAETLAQGPSRSHTPPQLSVSTQKLEELALKQSRLLIPMTPSMPRSQAASPSEKSKVKTGKQQYPFSYSRPLSNSPRGGPANSDLPKITCGTSHKVSASRELNGVTSAAKDSFASGGRLVGAAATSTSINAPSTNLSNNTRPAVQTRLEKRPTSRTQSRTEFFKNLSRRSSLKNPCSESSALQSGDSPSVDASSVLSSTRSSSIISGNDNACSELLKFSSNGTHHSSANPIMFPEEEEIAFLRSLGWEESAEEDEGLTVEEIRDFFEKYTKLRPLSNILQKMHHI